MIAHIASWKETPGGEWIAFKTPYVSSYVTRLKEGIPSSDRRWAPDLGVWLVRVGEHSDVAIMIVMDVFDVCEHCALDRPCLSVWDPIHVMGQIVWPKGEVVHIGNAHVSPRRRRIREDVHPAPLPSRLRARNIPRPPEPPRRRYEDPPPKVLPVPAPPSRVRWGCRCTVVLVPKDAPFHAQCSLCHDWFVCRGGEEETRAGVTKALISGGLILGGNGLPIGEDD